MAAATLQVGALETLTQNVAAALPSKRCILFTDAAAPTIQQSTTEAFTANVAVTLTGGQAEVAGLFIRCTNANISLVLKSF